MSITSSLLDELAAIGPPPGANRPGLSAVEEEAISVVAARCRDHGLEVERDAVGNLVARLIGRRPDIGEVWTGSHVDTVPAGGRFDGALGVALAVEAVGRLAAGPQLERTVAVVVLRDEEGWRFGNGLFGSRALLGAVGAEELELRDAEGVSVAEALAAVGRAGPTPGVPSLAAPAAFLEAHVEQGSVLNRRGAPVGVVTAITGMLGYEVQFEGRAAHAGTTAWADRRDALVAAAAYALALRGAARELPDAVATVGRLVVEPGATNVVPRRAVVSVDARAPEPGTLEGLEGLVASLAERVAAEEGCTVAIERRFATPPVPMDATIRDRIGEAIAATGREAVALPSGAGHDAATFAEAGIPTGMLFVRSLADGASHTPDEQTDAAAITVAADVLTTVLADLASPDIVPRGGQGA
jgi:hydantoinase/carbamoylase family amidase